MDGCLILFAPISAIFSPENQFYERNESCLWASQPLSFIAFGFHSFWTSYAWLLSFITVEGLGKDDWRLCASVKTRSHASRNCLHNPRLPSFLSFLNSASRDFPATHEHNWNKWTQLAFHTLSYPLFLFYRPSLRYISNLLNPHLLNKLCFPVSTP